MGSFIGLLLLIGMIALVVRGIAALAPSAKSSRPRIAADWDPPKCDPLPYSKRKYFFSRAERSFYEVLHRLVPDHTVFAKVRLSDVVYVNRGTTERQSFLNRIIQKHVDFILCDGALSPILAIELDDSSHDSASRSERDEFVDSVLAAAGLPLLHVRAKHGYVLEEVRQTLSPYIGEISRGSSQPSRFSGPQSARAALTR
jgi:hypothetical protein